jgi:hypothetical protein
MTPGGGKAASPIQVARYGHVAALLRAEMAKRKWTNAQFNEALGQPRASPGIYQWLGCKGAPGTKLAPKVAKLLGVPVASLLARRDGASPPTEVAVLAPPQPAVRRAEVLSFSVTDDGHARLRLDVTLPIEQASALLRTILDVAKLAGEAAG